MNSLYIFSSREIWDVRYVYKDLIMCGCSIEIIQHQKLVNGIKLLQANIKENLT